MAPLTVTRWITSALCLILGVVGVSSTALGQTYPDHVVRIVVPFTPGGVADSGARLVADRLSARWGKPVVVENRPGAGGNLGTQQVAAAPPDGYTLLLGYDGTLVINPSIYEKLRFDTLKDFVPITKIGDATLILVAHPSVEANNLRELIANEKDKQVRLSYGTAGIGSTPHLAGELLSQQTGLPLSHVPYKGGAQTMADVMSGAIPLAFTAVSTAQQFVKQGRLKALAVSGAKRAPSLPEVSTFVENGVDGFDVDSWIGLLAPAATPHAIIDQLQKEVAGILTEPTIRERLADLGVKPVGNTSNEFRDQIRADLSRWERVTKQANIKME